MTSAAKPMRQLPRSRVIWLTAQLLLGVGIARPTTSVVVGIVVILVALALAERVVRIQVITFALLVTTVAASPSLWPVPALVAGAFLLLRSGRAVDVRAPATRIRALRPTWLLGITAGVAAAVAVLPLVLLEVHSAPLAFPVAQPSLAVMCCLVVVAAVLNALAEESLWRGSIIATDKDLGLEGRTTVAVQACGFGIAHWHGIPGGVIGVIAAAAFGAVMAWLRLRTRIGPAVVAHVIADVAIFSVAAATAVFVPV